jgi:hypothetical protein
VPLAAEPAPPAYPQLNVVARVAAVDGSEGATLTLAYADSLVDHWSIADETSLGVFERAGDGLWRWRPALVNAATNTVITQVDATAAAWTVGPAWMMTPWQQRTILGADFAAGERNVLIIHGWNSEPWDACMLQLTAGVAPVYGRVAAVAYPSALDIVENAAWLRAEIERRWPETPFDIIAFSEGGLVARAAIEPHVWNGDAGINAPVRRLVTIATPHEGILPDVPLSLFNDTAALQMRPGSSFLRELNTEVRHDGTAYSLIAGDTGAGDDGVVPIGSALAVDSTGPTQAATLSLPHTAHGVGARGLPCDQAVYDQIAIWAE